MVFFYGKRDGPDGKLLNWMALSDDGDEKGLDV